jgi:AraC-like DNA-binding protein
MLLANKLLKKEDIRIKELAVRMGYENAGKFSQAFKKHNSVLPSKWQKQ